MDEKTATRIAPATEAPRNGHSHPKHKQQNGSGVGTGLGAHNHGRASSVAASEANTERSSGTPKKRRKVNHACVYCRRSHMTCDLSRPCTRCQKRNIGHLCHDEPRDSESRKSKSVVGTSVADESEDFSDSRRASAALDHKMASNSMPPPAFDASSARDASKPAFNAAVLGQAASPLQLVRPGALSGMQPNPSDVSQFAGFSDAWLTQFDMHNHNGYMIVPEVSGELQFLNDFLHSSMVDDAAFVDDQNAQLLRSAPPNVDTNFLTSPSATSSNITNNKTSNSSADPDPSHTENLISPGAVSGRSMLPPPSGTLDSSNPGTNVPRTPQRVSGAGGGFAGAAANNADKTRNYYLTAADPSGNDTPEQRMWDLLKAKYEAGLLKPFNYINGYARLRAYLDSHQIAPVSKQKIQRQLDRFRPKFREKMQALDDLQLVYVEMWFERTLMEYDRVFASMAVPACCWRRTGEIFRGNKEMAELIHVPVENLRDGKIAIHEILTEESVVRYWEEFGTIAFDPLHDTLLTACSIKSLDDSANDTVIKCCFSLKIRRDDHKIPSLIVGNFLPHDPLSH